MHEKGVDASTGSGTLVALQLRFRWRAYCLTTAYDRSKTVLITGPRLLEPDEPSHARTILGWLSCGGRHERSTSNASLTTDRGRELATIASANERPPMGVVIENTPNPNALKFTVGGPVGPPATFTDTATADERVAPILELEGVASLFMTADFVTVTRQPTADWESLAPIISDILERSFG